MSPDDSQPIKELKWLALFFDSHGHARGARNIAREVKKVRRMAQSSLNEEDASNVVKFQSLEKETQPIAELRWLAQFFSARGHNDSALEINEQLNRLGCSDNQEGLLDRPVRGGHDNLQALKELQWLAKYFRKHGDEPAARRIYSLLKTTRKDAQSMLSGIDASDVQHFGADDTVHEHDAV